MRKLCSIILKLMGWTTDGSPVPENKCIILGVPHTSMMDFVVSYLYYTSVGGHARCMIKKELFFPPLGWLLKALGAIPVDRKNSTTLVRSVIKEMESSDFFHLAIAPEGTRKPVRNWKTGFHLIAKEAGIPVYMGYFDWKTKRVGHGVRIELTDDARADMKRIQQLYEEMNLGAKHPEMYLTK